MLTLCSLSPSVPMVEPAEAWQRSHAGAADFPSLDRTPAGRVFAQRVVDAVLLVIADVLADDTAQVFFIDRNDIVEDLAATASNPPFGGSVLPRGVNARPSCFESGRLQECNHVLVKDGIVIENRVAIRTGFRKRFAELLHDPIRRRMPRHVEMQDSATFVLDHEETVQHAEGRGRHREEVERDDRLAVVVKECEPFLAGIATPPCPREVAGDGSLRQHKAELLQFAVDLWRAPVGVLLGQAANQSANLRGDPRPAATRPRFPAPVQLEAGPMPTHYRFGLDDYQRVAPAGPRCTQDRPEEPIERAQRRSWPFPLQDGELLAECDDLDSKLSTCLEVDTNRGKHG